MENTMDLIRKVSFQIAQKSELSFLINDIESVLKAETPFNNRETIERLRHAFINANYAGDLLAGELSFLLDYHLRGYDIRSELLEVL